MARPRKTAEPAAAAKAVKTETPAVETAAEEIKPEKKKTSPAKKAAAKKTASETVYIQYNGAEITTDSIIEKAKAASGISSPKSVNIYIRPEINKVFYVIDEESYGDFELS